MSTPPPEPSPEERAALRRELRARLGQLGVSLQILAEDLLGEGDEAIDWVAIEPDGRAWVGLVELGAGTDTMLVRGLAQRSWVQARLPDWMQLAPGLEARAELRPRLLLLAAEFSRTLRVAAREADAEGIRLACYRWRAGRRGLEAVLEPLPAPQAPRAALEPAPPRLASVFRSGLRDADFESGS